MSHFSSQPAMQTRHGWLTGINYTESCVNRGLATVSTSPHRPTAPERGMASRRRQRAVRDALAGGPMPDDMTADEFGAAAARHSSRQALQLARACFDNTISASAEQIAAKLVELAMDGSVPALLTVARSVVPPAKFDETFVDLKIGEIKTAEDIDRARSRLAEGVFNGCIGVESAGNLARLLDNIAEARLRDEQTQLIASMRETLAATAEHGIGGALATLSARAERVLQGTSVPLIEAVEQDGGELW